MAEQAHIQNPVHASLEVMENFDITDKALRVERCTHPTGFEGRLYSI